MAQPSMLYRGLIRPLLYLLTPETAHHLMFGLLRFAAGIPGVGALLRAIYGVCDPRLAVKLWDRTLSSPVGLAAGFDKDARGFTALCGLGFGFVEVGTVTGEPQRGNPKPRLFRLPRDRALINRMGFNNRGAADAAVRLAGRGGDGVVGVNIGKTKLALEDAAIEDYLKSASLLAPHADYLVVNVSSPNTPGLRDLQAVQKLEPLLTAVRDRTRELRSDPPLPLFVKIAPDLSDEDVDAVTDLALSLGLDGIIATNTTISRDGLSTVASEVERCGAGGLSGAPVKARALEVLRRIRRRAGNRLVLIAAGGIETAEDAWERIRAGATLVQVYTALIYEGPGLPRRMAKALARLATEAGFERVQDAVGSDREPP